MTFVGCFRRTSTSGDAHGRIAPSKSLALAGQPGSCSEGEFNRTRVSPRPALSMGVNKYCADIS
jgi:hypothetical protein